MAKTQAGAGVHHSILSAKRILRRAYDQGMGWITAKNLEFDLQDELHSENVHLGSVLSALIEEKLIDDSGPPDREGATQYRIRPSVLTLRMPLHLGLLVDDEKRTVQRPEVDAVRTVSLSEIQTKLMVAMCASGNEGITEFAADRIRNGESSAKRQFRTELNKRLSALGVKLDRGSWRIVGM